MNVRASGIDTTDDPRAWRRELGRYREPRTVRSVLEILITAIPFALLWGLTWLAVNTGYWVGLVLALPATGFLVRLFMIQHDCSHGSFFRSRRANDWVGRVIGVFTLTPYDLWRHRLRYRLYRHPLVLFGIGPAYVFLLDHRLPVNFMRSGWMPWVSTMGTNAAIVLVAAGVIGLVGVGDFLLVQGPITLLASAMGVWLFYVQHQTTRTWATGISTALGVSRCMASSGK